MQTTARGIPKTMANPQDLLSGGFWEAVKNVGLITAVGALLRLWIVDRRKVVDDAHIAKETLKLEQDKAIHERVKDEFGTLIGLMQSETRRIQEDFNLRMTEVKTEATRERDRLIEQFEARKKEDDFAYAELERQIVQMKTDHLLELHKLELRHQTELNALKIQHAEEKSALMNIIDRLETDIVNVRKTQEQEAERRSS